ncbi:ANTAR domain-containing response regulator [Streptomyces beijiangensis]|uniref:GAF and ANTAR domain-containing protein n=1 Tax=Streptomyces beijiangensis TaxID=163361 RepID=A0A939F5P0_9ACTN|nr:GAF and ANTAR domain-containing protein [Streptomyces beijiangensis]MBO0512199.1 GAF and ANTAR domain-containing protein [Streptomyces beijiangensis]
MLPDTEYQGSEAASTVRKLTELAEQSVRCTTACCGAVVTVADGTAERRAAATHPDLAALASVQLASGEGPIADALSTGEPVDTEDLLNEDRWPEYRAVALESGVRSTVTLPFGRAGIGVTLSLYSFRAGALEAAVLAPATALGEQAVASLVRERRYRAALAEVDQLESALRSRPVIDQASGIVMHVLGCDAAEAFQLLRRISQGSNRRLAEVAEAVAASKGHGLEKELTRFA